MIKLNKETAEAIKDKYINTIIDVASENMDKKPTKEQVLKELKDNLPEFLDYIDSITESDLDKGFSIWYDDIRSIRDVRKKIPDKLNEDRLFEIVKKINEIIAYLEANNENN